MEIKNLSYYYPESQSPSLNNINLILEEGEVLMIAGGSGSGKSTLARVLTGLIPDFYGGRISGRVFFHGKSIRETERRLLCSSIGMVFQDPEKQLVMTSVEAEIAFGLENMGLANQEMERRIAEVMSFLELTNLKKEFTANLSGGQKQKVALAAVLAMQPEVLILDEPTSQLDPMAAEEFLNMVERLNQELGYTVVLIEQRLERCFHLADRLILMEKGEIICDRPMGESVRWQASHGRQFIPPVAKFFALLNAPAIPLTIKEGRRKLREIIDPLPPVIGTRNFSNAAGRLKSKRANNCLPTMLEAKDVWFSYPKGREALKGLSLTIEPGDFAVVMGGNGAGKSTFLKLAVGLLKPDRGRMCAIGIETKKIALQELARHIGYLSQNPNDYLFQDTVEKELFFTLDNLGLEDNGRVKSILKKLGLEGMSKTNPRDLSGGERQRTALASVLVAGPEMILMDEPTRGLDCILKTGLGALLQDLNRLGMTVVMVTHDVEFAAEYARRIILMFDGRVAADGSALQIMRDSLFYSPQMTRLFKGYADDVLVVKDGLEKIYMGSEMGDTLG